MEKLKVIVNVDYYPPNFMLKGRVVEVSTEPGFHLISEGAEGPMGDADPEAADVYVDTKCIS
jgi:hypothetical protein